MRGWVVVLGLGLALAGRAGAVEARWREGDLRGFPTLLDAQGQPLGPGRYAQWVEGDTLHIKASFSLRDGRQLVEEAELTQAGELRQQRWSWEERRGATVLRRYAVDLRTGHATAFRADQNRVWQKELGTAPGRTFVGLGIAFAVKNLRDRLLAGEAVELEVVGFTPAPHLAHVRVSWSGRDLVPEGRVRLEADRFTLHPLMPALAKLVVPAPDSELWIYRAPPAQLLRARAPLAEAGDPLVEQDLLDAGAFPARRPTPRPPARPPARQPSRR